MYGPVTALSTKYKAVNNRGEKSMLTFKCWWKRWYLPRLKLGLQLQMVSHVSMTKIVMLYFSEMYQHNF